MEIIIVGLAIVSVTSSLFIIGLAGKSISKSRKYMDESFRWGRKRQ